MTNLPLWSTLCRADGPSTSRAAAITAAQTLGQRQAFALECVRQMPGATSLELDTRFCPGQRNTIQRRLGELERAGLVERLPARRCSISGKNAATWRARA